jgi:hypothetical protein
VTNDPVVAGSPGWLLSLLGAYLAVWSILGVGFVIAVILAAVKIKRLASQASRQIKATADPVLSTVRDVSGRVQRIGETVETTVSGMARKVDAASDTFAGPAALIAAFVSGVRRGAATGGGKRPGSGDGRAEP